MKNYPAGKEFSMAIVVSNIKLKLINLNNKSTFGLNSWKEITIHKMDYFAHSMALTYTNLISIIYSIVIETTLLSMCTFYFSIVGGRVVHSLLLQLSERWPCHIWLFDRMKFVSLEACFGMWWWWGVGRGIFVYLILLFSLYLSGRRSNMTKILLTGTLNLNVINQSIFQCQVLSHGDMSVSDKMPCNAILLINH